MNNIHLLPSFDIGTVNEDYSQVIQLSDSLREVCNKAPQLSPCAKGRDMEQTLFELLDSFNSNSDLAQRVVSELRAVDNYNWGYDPFHYTVPEGSYALNPDGVARIVEFREMVQNLHTLGFRIIMDVVYNHTH